jgi:primosomal protein N' (replication factor Y)
MSSVKVLINSPASRDGTLYVYSVPEELKNEIDFGKRVLVQQGKRLVEGYIIEINQTHNYDRQQIKPIIKVLDIEPVFDRKRLELALWMADYYMCALPEALDTIIPTSLKKKRSSNLYFPATSNELGSLNYDSTLQKYKELFSNLYKKGWMSADEIKYYVDEKALKELVKSGLITSIGEYSGYKYYSKDSMYVLNKLLPSSLLLKMEKRAPQQAKALKLLRDKNQIDKQVLEKIVPVKSIRILEKRGLIKLVEKKPQQSQERLVLNHEQAVCLRRITKAISNQYHEKILLFGITGSGKTEVYIQAAEKCIELGKNVIVLIPEIALTKYLSKIFASKIRNIAVIHSGMSKGERYAEWKRIERDEVNLVLGTRSAIFAPISRLGLIIIDEEQDNSYKQEEKPAYHAREVAFKRAELESAVVVLGSATPSIESFQQAISGNYSLIYLKQRANQAGMPQIHIEDMRRDFANGNRSSISLELHKRITEKLEKGEQTILFLNRRGYSPITLCRECGSAVTCKSCSVGMAYHQDINRLVCHYCNYTANKPSQCYVCGSKHIYQSGYGTQRVEEEVKQLFPGAAVARLDMDVSRKKGYQNTILDKMKKKKIDILVGTQMVAKGFDFPEVSLVGVIDADILMNIPDFRARERCFQLIVQAAGRAGRGRVSGQVVVQTYNPQNDIFHNIVNQDYEGFYFRELEERRVLNYPPYTHLLRMVVVSEYENNAKAIGENIASQIRSLIDANEEEVEILGPAPCPLRKISNRFRYHIIIKSSNLCLLQSIGKHIQFNRPRGIKVAIDLNPVTIM